MTENLVQTDTLIRVAAVQPPGYHGHGILAAFPVHLLRLGMCNLSCDWCEAPETVAALGARLDTTAPYETTRALAARLLPQLTADPEVPLLITGGEPLVQDMAILDLAQRLTEDGASNPLWVETNGTIPPPDWWDDFIVGTLVSPKVGTRDPQHRRLTGAHEAWARAGGLFDFTCATASDVLLAAQVCTWLAISPATCTITPRGTTHDEQGTSLAAVHDEALAHGFPLTPRPLTQRTSAHDR